MQIPETPPSVTELDLMKRLNEYANGTASWTTDGLMPGDLKIGSPENPITLKDIKAAEIR